jgi:hypothetical protein
VVALSTVGGAYAAARINKNKNRRTNNAGSSNEKEENHAAELSSRQQMLVRHKIKGKIKLSAPSCWHAIDIIRRGVSIAVLTAANSEESWNQDDHQMVPTQYLSK